MLFAVCHVKHGKFMEGKLNLGLVGLSFSLVVHMSIGRIELYKILEFVYLFK
jgi:hypothetical protein